MAKKAKRPTLAQLRAQITRDIRTELSHAAAAQAAAELTDAREQSTREKLDGWAMRLRFDEPVFTLRAHDMTAPNIVRRWAASAADLSAPAEKIGDAMLTAARMERWQQANGCKRPD